LFGKPAEHRRHVGDAFARPPNSFCNIIYDRSECRCARRSKLTIDDRGADVINLATSTPVNGCDRTAARVGAQL
jgi:hypothetical protein